MSRTCSLDSQTTKINLVIRKGVYIPTERIIAFLQLHANEYAFICHEHDIKFSTGEVESVHYHIVFNAKTNKIRLSTRLNDIVKFFGFDNAFGIEIEMYKSFEGSLQYLIHKNDPQKTQHDISEVITNIDDGDFKLYMSCNIDNVITFERLHSAILCSANLGDLIRDIGLTNYRSWRNVILDMWKVYK